MSAYHVLLGVIGLVYGEELEYIAHSVFNLSLTVTPQILSLIRPLAAYLVVFGVIMGIAAYDPKRFRPVIYAGLVVLFFRLLQYLSIIIQGFQVSANRPSQTYGLMFVVIFTGLAFIFLLYKTKPNKHKNKNEKK
ncbi:MAG: hypothetical protein AABX78_02225 [Nanoarchaeota archaeon]